MIGYNSWNYKPYLPVDQLEKSDAPYICRLAPGRTSCEAEWLSNGSIFYLTYSIRGQNNWHTLKTTSHEHCFTGLEENTEYEFYVTDDKQHQSQSRLFRTGEAVGTVVNYLHPEDEQYGFSGQYLCSPSIEKLPNGTLLASMDVFKGDAPQNLTLLFRSFDNGVHWHYVSDIFPCFWGKLFWHKNRLYMLGVSREYGDLLIGCSEDFGETWSTPTVILRGSSFSQENGNHRAPTVILHSHGRIWTGTEYGSWSKGIFLSSLLSIHENDDLMMASNWKLSNFTSIDSTCAGFEPDIPGAIEGNAVELPDGRVADILRYSENKALIMIADPDNPEAALYQPQILDFPVGHTKFECSRHSNGLYYLLGNPYPGRNILSLYVSNDLKIWHKSEDIINHSECSIEEVGFQYPSYCFDGKKILILSRTAWNHAHNFHDSNYITFHQTTVNNASL